MNIALLTQVKEKILADPDQFHMGGWLVDQEEWDDYRSSDDKVPERTIPNCGTAACIGGWAFCLGNYERYVREAKELTALGMGENTVQEDGFTVYVSLDQMAKIS